uniref:Uncharacterized protein n=1 Tax=Picea sitchensis TaxID=3332 RepID=D5A8Q8_PICSI|nr:unknown [Picea sitchensis]
MIVLYLFLIHVLRNIMVMFSWLLQFKMTLCCSKFFSLELL